jgi:hypothetical protein
MAMLLKAWNTSRKETKPDIVVFLDGDYSDYPQDLTQIIARYWMIILILLLAPSEHLQENIR